MAKQLIKHRSGNLFRFQSLSPTPPLGVTEDYNCTGCCTCGGVTPKCFGSGATPSEVSFTISGAADSSINGSYTLPEISTGRYWLAFTPSSPAACSGASGWLLCLRCGGLQSEAFAHLELTGPGGFSWQQLHSYRWSIPLSIYNEFDCDLTPTFTTLTGLGPQNIWVSAGAVSPPGCGSFSPGTPFACLGSSHTVTVTFVE